jgi:hypothetical protein
MSKGLRKKERKRKKRKNTFKSGHYILPASLKGSECTPLGLIFMIFIRLENIKIHCLS